MPPTARSFCELGGLTGAGDGWSEISVPGQKASGWLRVDAVKAGKVMVDGIPLDAPARVSLPAGTHQLSVIVDASVGPALLSGTVVADVVVPAEGSVRVRIDPLLALLGSGV